MNIATIVENVMNTRVLTSRQQHQIDMLLKHRQYGDEDLDALGVLVEALSLRIVVSGGNSLMVAAA